MKELQSTGNLFLLPTAVTAHLRHGYSQSRRGEDGQREGRGRPMTSSSV